VGIFKLTKNFKWEVLENCC